VRKGQTPKAADGFPSVVSIAIVEGGVKRIGSQAGNAGNVGSTHGADVGQVWSKTQIQQK
jgi:hypothetical protein